jgi:membrane protein YdbS with pleckstrin-like domain
VWRTKYRIRWRLDAADRRPPATIRGTDAGTDPAPIGTGTMEGMTDVGLRPPIHRVSRRAIPYWLTRAAVGWLAILAAQAVPWLLGWTFPPWWGMVLAVTSAAALLHLAVMPRWRYRVHRWELAADAVYTTSGWWTQESRIAPTSRIQTVDTERGALGRLFGLSRITVTTASAAGPLVIDGLDDETARRIAHDATEAARAARDDAT